MFFLPVLVAVLYLVWPVYGYFAEDKAGLRAPWGWQTVPEAKTCHSGVTDPSVRHIADEACQLLLDYQAALRVPSLSAAIAIDGTLVWSGAVGWADIGASVPATSSTLYRIGSTSKPVTGTLLARMVDVGLVSLDEPIGNYIDDLPNPGWHTLTLRQLASHTAGLPEYGTNEDILGLYQSIALRRAHTDVRQGLALFDGSPQRFTPGSDFEYSSFGALLIASVLQEVAGKPFTQLMDEQVLMPLALQSPVPDKVTADSAQFYQLRDNHAKPWRFVDLSNKLPGGGFMSRPEDLVRLGSAWLDTEFISAETRAQFWQPQRLSSGEINEQSYALTWRWNEAAAYAHHGGVSKGAMAWLAVYPSSAGHQSLAVALTINTKLERFGDFSSLQTRLAQLFLSSDIHLP
ncbi:MAG: serine hydrolase domain-containing protein [Pseudohongiella sp.]|nr:serine hydrolase domain-containing protein [Pseudohongiella sp.]MDP2127050.1 serine hydrolase domain-containing protein [Pseudohongiella sp.]